MNIYSIDIFALYKTNKRKQLTNTAGVINCPIVSEDLYQSQLNDVLYGIVLKKIYVVNLL